MDRNDCTILMKLPHKLRERLLPFQKEGVKFAVQKNGRCLIADEMGLGKTIQAISVAYCYKEEWPLLIIVPSSLKFCWIEELEKWLPDVLPHEINLVQSGCDVSGMAICPITIVTYGLLRLPSSRIIREALSARKFNIIICDESHYLKNINTLSCKTVIPLLKSANRRILLSGTPALAKPVELYPQIDAICPGKFGTFWQYTDKYCDAHNVYFGKFKKREVNGASNLEELQQKLASMLMIRREKSEVLTELPPKLRQRIMFELKNSPLRKEIYDTFAELKRRIQKGDKTIEKVLHMEGQGLDDGSGLPGNGPVTSDASAVSIYSLISRLYKLSGEAKIGPVREYVEMLCEDEQLKFLVFAYHHDMMDGIQQTLWEKKIKFVRIDGSTRSSDRQTLVNQFQSDQETRVAILSILAAGVGLTFTAAKLVVFSELYWTPGVMVQCEDRAHRIGQTSSLPVHYLVARDTMDEWVWSAVCRKTLVTSTALTGKTRQLDHSEGASHQIELLSNADVWKQENTNADVDVAQLVQSQRPGDQSSILEFFQSQRSPDTTTLTRKRKHQMIAGIARSSALTSASQGCPSLEKNLFQKSQKNELDSEKMEKSKPVKFDMNFSEMIVISDDENDFKPVRKTRKTENKKLKTREYKKSKTQSEHVLGVTSSVTIPTFDLSYFEESLDNSETTLGSSDSSSLSDVSGYNNTECLTKEKTKSGISNKQFMGSDKVECSYSGIDGEMGTHTETLGDADTDLKELGSSMEQFVSTSTTSDLGSRGSCCGECQAHSCHSGSNDQQIVKATSKLWSCGICTFFNHSELPRCEMCDTPKKKSSSKREPNTSPGFSKTESSCHDNTSQTAATSKTLIAENSPLVTKVPKKNKHNPHTTNVSQEFTALRTQNSSSVIDSVTSHDQILSGFNNGRKDGDSEVVSPATDLRHMSHQRTSHHRNLFPLTSEKADSERGGESPCLFDGEGENDSHISDFENYSNGVQSSGREFSGSESENLRLENVSRVDVLPVSRCTDDQSSSTANSGTQLDTHDITDRITHSVLKFSCSIHTGRIYVYDEKGHSLQASFRPIDIEMGSTEELPEVLQLPHHMHLLQKFVREWSSLTDTKKRLIAKRCQIFISPRATYEEIKTVHGSKQRHLTKHDTLTAALKNVGKHLGSVQMISKWQTTPAQCGAEIEGKDGTSTSVTGIAQVVTDNGVPLCLQCHKPYTNSLLSAQTITNPENAWQLRLCSFACMDKYWTLSKGSYCRDQIYDIEHGVCQICRYDAHTLFTQIKISRDLRVRADLIKSSPYRTLSQKQKEKILEQPQAGQFWHVDHITPVWQGGGMCDLDNLRTLCTPCHLKVTRRQAGQRATIKKLSVGVGQSDITAFFQRS